jgi:hypothetical protein
MAAGDMAAGAEAAGDNPSPGMAFRSIRSTSVPLLSVGIPAPLSLVLGILPVFCAARLRALLEKSRFPLFR